MLLFSLDIEAILVSQRWEWAQCICKGQHISEVRQQRSQQGSEEHHHLGLAPQEQNFKERKYLQSRQISAANAHT